MPKILDDSVAQADDGSWTFQCPGIVGLPCHTTEGVPFSSRYWPSKKVAAARGDEHFKEHQLGAHLLKLIAEAGEDHDRAALLQQAMDETGLSLVSPVEEFREKHGLVVHPNGTHAVRIEDLP
jgi:hypothetical protein